MNPNFKHIVKKLTHGSHKSGTPFPKIEKKKGKQGSTDWKKTFLDMDQPHTDNLAKKQRKSKQQARLDELSQPILNQVKSKSVKEHRADKYAARDKYQDSNKTEADKLEKKRSLGERKRSIKNVKENKKIARLAAKKGISTEDATKLREERKQKGKDFWRNFGSQMVRYTSTF